MRTISTCLLPVLAFLAQSAALGAERECATRVALLRIPFQEYSGKTLPLTAEQRFFEFSMRQLFLDKSASFLDTESLVFAKGLDVPTARWIIQASTISTSPKVNYPLSKISGEIGLDFIVVDSNNGTLIKKTCGPGCQKTTALNTYLIASANDGVIKWKINGLKEVETTSITDNTQALEKLTTHMANEVFSRLCTR